MVKVLGFMSREILVRLVPGSAAAFLNLAGIRFGEFFGCRLSVKDAVPGANVFYHGLLEEVVVIAAAASATVDRELPARDALQVQDVARDGIDHLGDRLNQRNDELTDLR